MQRRTSRARLPAGPKAASATWGYVAPGTASRASRRRNRQKSVRAKPATMAPREKAQPPLRQFLGIQRNPMATKPFTRAKYVSHGPSFLGVSSSGSFI